MPVTTSTVRSPWYPRLWCGLLVCACATVAAGPATRPAGPSAATRPDPRLSAPLAPGESFIAGDNPLIRDAFTADPTALVSGGRLYLYTGHDEAPYDARDSSRDFLMRDWRCYSTADMKTWRFEGTPLRATDFAWAAGSAFAASVIERDGTFYFYAPVWAKDGSGFAIGVASSKTPAGPFTDALGAPLVRNADTPTPGPMLHDDIDPAAFIDRDGNAWLLWGNTHCYLAPLKPNMTELAGPIRKIDLPAFTEAPHLHAHGGRYYLTYAHRYPETIAYATAERVEGPYVFRGVINDVMPGCRTNHQAVVEFLGRWWFFYHGAPLSGFELRRSVGVEELSHDAEGRIVPVVRTGLMGKVPAVP